MSDSTHAAPSIVPSPDPSVITTAQIDKVRAELRADYTDKIAALGTILDTRLDAMDQASVILSENVNRVPTLLDREVLRVIDMLKRSEELMTEKFAAVAQQFKERDIRFDQDKAASATAISAALSALKELIALQNSNTTKQVDSILALLASTNTALNDKVGVINGRLDRGDGGHSAGAAYLTTGLAVAAIIVSLGIGVFSLAGRGSVTEMLPASAVTPR